MIRFLGFALLIAQTVTCAAGQPLRISAWYWLNSAPRDEWDRDFRKMADLGFTHVDLCWGLDAAAWTPLLGRFAWRTLNMRFKLAGAKA